MNETGPGESDALTREVIREGTTMALYISLSQLAVLTALPAGSGADENLWWLILATSIGLVLAHQVAFRMSARLVSDGSRLDKDAPVLLRAQLLGGAAVTALAVLPVLVFGPSALRWSIGLLLAFVMIVGYLVARSTPTSRWRALAYVVFVALVVVGVLVVKTAVAH